MQLSYTIGKKYFDIKQGDVTYVNDMSFLSSHWHIHSRSRWPGPHSDRHSYKGSDCTRSHLSAEMQVQKVRLNVKKVKMNRKMKTDTHWGYRGHPPSHLNRNTGKSWSRRYRCLRFDTGCSHSHLYLGSRYITFSWTSRF